MFEGDALSSRSVDSPLTTHHRQFIAASLDPLTKNISDVDKIFFQRTIQ